MDEQGGAVEEALGDLSTTDTSDAGDAHGGAQAEDVGINESTSRNDLRRIHTMETFSWQGYSMQQHVQAQQNQQSRTERAAAEPQKQESHASIQLAPSAPSAAYPSGYTQQGSSQWGRQHRELPADQWATGAWPSETWASAVSHAASHHQGPNNGLAPEMPAQNSFLRGAHASQAGYLQHSEAKFQQNWYPAGTPGEDVVQTAFRPVPEQPEVPNKQPSLVPVPVPVMMGPNGTMIPVPMGPNGMGLQLPPGVPQPLPPQAQQGIGRNEVGQQMVFLGPNGVPQGMQLFGFVNAPQQQEAPKKQQVKEAPTESSSTFGDDITLMLRNLPNKINQTKLLSRLQNYRNKIDFLYLPTDFENKCNLGYAFINFVDGAAAARFKAEFNDKKLPGCRRSHKVLAVQPARVQGVSANVRRFRNSSVMGVLSEDEKPMLFKEGVQIPFPMPDGPLPPVGPRYPREGEPSAA
jgi:hypothetical protein